MSGWLFQFRLFVGCLALALCLRSMGVAGSGSREPIPWYVAGLLYVGGILAPGAVLGALAGELIPVNLTWTSEQTKEVGA